MKEKYVEERPWGKFEQYTHNEVSTVKIITVKAGDGYDGWKEYAPFDAIIVTCSAEKIPLPLIEQLKDPQQDRKGSQRPGEKRTPGLLF